MENSPPNWIEAECIGGISFDEYNPLCFAGLSVNLDYYELLSDVYISDNSDPPYPPDKQENMKSALYEELQTEDKVRKTKAVKYWFSRGFKNNNGAIVLVKNRDSKGVRFQHYISKAYKEELLIAIFKEKVLT